MQQAIAEAGLGQDDITNERTGIIMGSGGPSTKTIVEAAELTTRNGSPKRIGPFAVPKAMSSTASATLATWFKIHGVNYSISSACSTSAHCIGNAYELIQWGKQDMVFAGGHEDLDWTMSNLFDAMGAMSSKFNDRAAVASRAYDAERDGFVIAGGAGVLVVEGTRARQGAAAPTSLPRSWVTAPPPTVTTWSHRPARVRCAACARRLPPSTARSTTSTPTAPPRRSATRRRSAPSARCSETRSLTSPRQSRSPAIRWGPPACQESIYSILMMNAGFIGESAHIETIDPEFEDMPIVRKRIDDARIDTVLFQFVRLRRDQRDAGLPALTNG